MNKISPIEKRDFFRCEELNIPYVRHFFFTRNILNSTNKYVDSKQDKKNQESILLNNRKIIASYFDLPKENICFLNQSHSNKIKIIDKFESLDHASDEDGMITKKENIILAIQTADCVPVLFADPIQKIIGAVHAGWRGARTGIIENIVSKLLAMGTKKDNLIACIGPCIHQKNYQISNDFYQNFLSETIDNKKFFEPEASDDKYRFNLPGYVINKLDKFGIKTFNMNLDTYSEVHNFFSYRRSCIERLSHEGSLVSAIALQC